MSGGTPSKSNPAFWGGAIPWISAKSLKSFYLFDSEDHVTDAAITDGARLVAPGDILMLVRGMTLHNDVPVGLAMRPMTFNQDVKGIRGAGDADTRFIAYWLVGNKWRLLAAVDQASHGTGRLRTEVVQAMDVLLPPPEEQRAIAAVLGSLDDKIEQNRRTARALERLARAIFRAWFVDFEPVKSKAAGATSFPSMPQAVFDALPTTFTDSDLGPVPEGWAVAAVSDVCDVNPPRPLRRGELAPCLEMKHMPTHGHAPDAWEERPFGSGTRFVNGDTLVARITPCLENGKTAFVDFLKDGQIGWGSTEYIVLRPKSPLPPVFAYCLARTVEFRDFAIQNMTGTSGRQRVAPAVMDHFQLAAPPQDLAVTFGDIVQPLFNSIRAGMEETRKLAALRDYLLPQVLSGQVPVEVGEAVAAKGGG